MRHIAKGTAPVDLVATAKATTTNLTTTSGARNAFNQIDKARAREALGVEQRNLCAFCNRRIDESAKDEAGQATLKIAHRIPVDVNPALALTWSNMLGSCDGGQSSGTNVRTCDAAQRNTALTLDPTQSASVARVRFERRDGRDGLFITSDDPAVRRDVEETLGLNRGDLPANRASAWRSFQTRARETGLYGHPAWRAQVARELAEAGSSLREYFGVLESMARSSRRPP